ncbi:MAG: GPR endopeptidase [Lachnospira sp.]|nr:GPR endopeptidase [Lachnospira sp.]
MKQDVKSFYHTSCHTDLAVEMKEEVERKQKLTGIEVITKNHRYHGIKETRIEITDSRGEAALGKPCGHYITLEMGKGSKRGVKNKLSQIVSEVLNDYLKDAKHILFVGLGNRQVTPDALGPEVMEQLTVTRHLKKFGLETQQDVKMLSALAPGVMAQTGMETVEAVRGVVREIHPDAIIVVDALAARSSERLNRTIQLCDTGICPGAGVGNNRQEMNEETLGVKVIAVGVPTVIAVPTIICDAMEQMLSLLGAKNADKQLEELDEEEQFQLASELVEPYFTDMFVTPKNIDEEIQLMSECIAQGINAYIEGEDA